jgi:hypothetical protein
MQDEQRTELHQEIVQALIDSKAVDFEAAGRVLAAFGARAALEGSGLAFNVNWRVVQDICIPPVIADRGALADG